jgi:hypothetical protein
VTRKISPQPTDPSNPAPASPSPFLRCQPCPDSKRWLIFPLWTLHHVPLNLLPRLKGTKYNPKEPLLKGMTWLIVHPIYVLPERDPLILQNEVAGQDREFFNSMRGLCSSLPLPVALLLGHRPPAERITNGPFYDSKSTVVIFSSPLMVWAP